MEVGEGIGRARFWGEGGGGCFPPNLPLTLPRRAPFQSSEYHPKFTRGGGRGIRRHREPFPYRREAGGSKSRLLLIFPGRVGVRRTARAGQETGRFFASGDDRLHWVSCP